MAAMFAKAMGASRVVGTELLDRLARWDLHPDRVVTDRFALADAGQRPTRGPTPAPRARSPSPGSGEPAPGIVYRRNLPTRTV
jgi:hypothetical protein